MNTTVIYKANYESAERILVNQGGTSSGKTYAILQLLFTYAIMEPYQIITVVGQDMPNLKKGAYRDAKRLREETKELQHWFGKPLESERIIPCKNGSIIEFTSYSNEQDAKSGKRDYLFINEANGIPYEVYRQLDLRTRQKVVLDYSPASACWLHDNLSGRQNVKLSISDHRHNSFLSDEEHARIEAIDDPEFFKVYARGMTGKTQGLIYQHWKLCDIMPQDFKKRYIGIDFGFTNDPTAIIDVRLSEGQLWIDEIAYEKGMLNSDIASVLRKNNIPRSVTVIADSAEPKSMAELKNMGFAVEGAKKGADSVKNGIDIVKRYKLNITRRSANIKKELLAYSWKVDKQTGEAVNEPVDMYNHA